MSRQAEDLLIQNIAEIRKAPNKGRGVFATRAIPAGTVIERCPVIVIPYTEKDSLYKTQLGHYVYEWTPYDDPEDESRMNFAVVLGWASLINHSGKPNVEWELDEKNEMMVFNAIHAIKPGEELCIDYNCELWFTPAK